MKKILAVSLALVTGTAVWAQGDNGINIDHSVFNIIATIFLIYLCMVFILSILKRMLEFRLKNKIIDKGIADHLATSILQTEAGNDKHINLKWFLILAGTGAGLIIVYYTMPLNIHSLAIMAFSISLSFLGYFIYLKKWGN